MKRTVAAANRSSLISTQHPQMKCYIKELKSSVIQYIRLSLYPHFLFTDCVWDFNFPTFSVFKSYFSYSSCHSQTFAYKFQDWRCEI